MSCCGQGKRSAVKILAAGAVGLTRVVLHTQDAAPEVIAARRDICRTCPHSEKREFAGAIQVRLCGLCKCLIRAKTRLAGQSCPDNRWGSVSKP